MAFCIFKGQKNIFYQSKKMNSKATNPGDLYSATFLIIYTFHQALGKE
jgi:hypothetical protein